MKAILDTHILLWWAVDDRRLSSKARRLMENANNHIIVSVASIWEIAIKQSIGRIKIDLKELEEAISINNFEFLPVKFQHAAEVANLPPHHSDPFDRMLVAQCFSETAYLFTQDGQLEKYGKIVMII